MEFNAKIISSPCPIHVTNPFVYTLPLTVGQVLATVVTGTCISYSSARRQGNFEFPSFEFAFPTNEERPIITPSEVQLDKWSMKTGRKIWPTGRYMKFLAWQQIVESEYKFNIENEFQFCRTFQTDAEATLVPRSLYEEEPAVGCEIDFDLYLTVRESTSGTFSETEITEPTFCYIEHTRDEEEIGPGHVRVKQGFKIHNYTADSHGVVFYTLGVNFGKPRDAIVFWDRNTKEWLWDSAPQKPSYVPSAFGRETASQFWFDTSYKFAQQE